MSELSKFSITSPDFEDGGEIPKKCGYKYENVNPSLKILVPADVKSVVIIMDDPDAKQAVGKVWVHWILYNIDSNHHYGNTHHVIIPSGSTETKLTKDEWDTFNVNLKKEILDRNKKILSETMTSRYGVVLAKSGLNSFGEFDYGGPAPPDKKHTYIFKAYALDIETLVDDLNEPLPRTNLPGTKANVEEAMKGHILGEAKLTGTFAP